MSSADHRSPGVRVPTLKGSRVVLRPLGVDGIGAMNRDDHETLEAVTGLRWPEKPPPDLADHLEKISQAARKTPDAALWWTWSIAEPDSVDACGAVGLNGPPGADGIVWIGYALYEQARGKGLATDAVETLTRWAFADERVRVVLASIAPDNHKSSAVAQRAGMRFHARTRAMDIYRLTRGQWRSR